MDTDNYLTINPMPPGELARMYGISVKTLRALVKLYYEQIGPRAGKNFSTNQIMAFIKCYGAPYVRIELLRS